jgi:hypothetical protein
MNDVLLEIISELDQLAAHINATVQHDDPFSVAHSNWTFPGLTRTELAEAASSLADQIRGRGGDELGKYAERLRDYPRRLTYMRENLVPQIGASAAAAVPAYFATLNGLREALAPALDSDDDARRAALALPRRVRSLQAVLNDLEPRSTTLAAMVTRIEDANAAADQLPTDLAALQEARQKIASLRDDANVDQKHILELRNIGDAVAKKLKSIADEASATLVRVESAYAAATSQGLAAAFSERSRGLNISMWIWVAGLIAALGFGATFGSYQLHSLAEAMAAPEITGNQIFLNIILAILSVSAPIWFSWLATKQIGQRFRLSEDYAFKASVSRAYEGYRREAARIDSDLEARLLASALDRLDEQPLRLVEAASYGSPWHELASSDLLKDAAKSVPGFAGLVKDLAKQQLSNIKIKKIKPSEPKPEDPPT